MTRYLILVLLALGIAACGGPATAAPDAVATQIAVEEAAHATMTARAPTATDIPDVIASQVAQALAAAATLTALAPAGTPSSPIFPTDAATLPPSPSPKPKPTATPTASRQATATFKPGYKPTAKPHATPTPMSFPPQTSMPFPSPTSAPAPKPTGAPTVPPIQQLLADSQADFCDSHGRGGWEYLSARRDSFNWTRMPYDGSCFYEDPHTRICADQGTPGDRYDVAWLYRVEAGGRVTIRVSAHKADPVGDDVEVSVYRHTELLYEWLLAGGDTEGFVGQFEQDAPEGELFFFTLHYSGGGNRGMVFDPNPVRIEVFLRP